MGRDGHPIRWLRDVTPAAWVTEAVDGSCDFVSALVPPRYEAYARLTHRGDGNTWFSLPGDQRRVLVDLLRSETTTPERCWFCVPDDNHDLDDQGVLERVDLPSGGVSYLLHGGPIELAMMPPPERTRYTPDRPDLTDAELREELAAELQEQEGASFTFTRDDATVAELAQALTDACPFLADVGPGLWWPDDRAWFVATDRFMKRTFVGGGHGLVDRLLAEPVLAAAPARATDELGLHSPLRLTEPTSPPEEAPAGAVWRWSPPLSRRS
jgi:hypothetical protein